MSRIKYSSELNIVSAKKDINKKLAEDIRLALAYMNKKQSSIRCLGSPSSVGRKIKKPLTMTVGELMDLSYELRGVLEFTTPLKFNRE